MDKETLLSLNKEKMNFLNEMNPLLREYLQVVAIEYTNANIRSLKRALSFSNEQEEQFQKYLDFETQSIADSILKNFATD